VLVQIINDYVYLVFKVMCTGSWKSFSNYESEQEAQLKCIYKQTTPTFLSVISPIMFHIKTCQIYTYTN
jgi:hypothetical protein